MAQLVTATPQSLAGSHGPLPVDDTPEQRILWKSTVSQSTLRRLERRVGSEKDICSITRETTNYVITVAHVIERGKKASNRVSPFPTASSRIHLSFVTTDSID